MKRTTQLLSATTLLAGLLAGNSALAGGMHSYEITITNATRGQVLTPPVIIAHDDDYSLFNIGMAASDELAALAEDGNGGPLMDALAMDTHVKGYTQGGLLPPGTSQTVTLTVEGRVLFTVAGMLASSNDAFYAVRGVKPSRMDETLDAMAYDAGSEANTESCAHIPGPPCGNPHVRVTDGAEGFVTVHSGIHSMNMAGMLDAKTHDWRGAVAEITIKRIH